MFNSVPNWLEHLLGISTESGEGTTWSVEYLWPWPPWATVLFLAMAGIFIATIYLREPHRGRGMFRIFPGTIRIALVLLLLLMIAQITLSFKRTGLPYAAVVVDDSLSMTTIDHYPETIREDLLERLKATGIEPAEPSRWNLARMLLSEGHAKMLHGIANDHKLRLFFLSRNRAEHSNTTEEVLEELNARGPSGKHTRLGTALHTVLDELRGTTPAGIILFTDGINTDGPALSEGAEYARRRGVPLFLIGLGSEQAARDLKLSDLLVDDVVFVDDIMHFECKLTATGYEGEKAVVVLREKDKPDVLAKVEATLGADGQSQTVRIPYRPTEVGQYEFIVEVEPLKGEVLQENNRQSKSVQVRKEKIRVLLVQAYPNLEYRYLRNMLERDDTITLHTVLQEADLEHAEQDASALHTFPMRREELFSYDVVIFGDVNPAMLNAAAIQNLADFVDQPAKGGALILIAGPFYMPSAYRETPLARFFPFSVENVRMPDPSRPITEGFLVQPTDIGLAMPSMQLGNSAEETLAIWRSLAPLYWLAEASELKPGVRVLAEHPSLGPSDDAHWPVFCLQYVGAGRVLFHFTDETWRWRYRVGDQYFARYWIQTIRYLCRTKLVDAGRAVLLTTDRHDYMQGEAVKLRARFADERLTPAEDTGAMVIVDLPGRQTQRVPLRRTATSRSVFEGSLAHPAPGEYHAWLASPAVEGQAPAVDFTVTPPVGEFAQVRVDTAEMRRISEMTGGNFYTIETARELLEDLPPGHQVPIETLPPLPLWNRWPILVLFLSLLITEWILRKRLGLI